MRCCEFFHSCQSVRLSTYPKTPQQPYQQHRLSDLEESPARPRHHSPDSDQGSEAAKSPPHGEGSMGDDELDELQSPGYDSEAPVAAVGSPYLGLHYTGPPADTEQQVCGKRGRACLIVACCET